MNYKIIDTVIQNIDIGVFKYVGSESSLFFVLAPFLPDMPAASIFVPKMPLISLSHSHNTEFGVSVITNKTDLWKTITLGTRITTIFVLLKQ